ncbi:hypothetical protein Forpe1208_v013987 [Fusarium oxysporum f. sp. rapae]|uniref:Serine protease n=1 Tax=Fusarium oxysporum f. sp. rapae TaxID=485398 RepID=A0A8J5TNZ0_FUSOX|nr:hypothetical protein Forpe1208_v013987 [Fusarium oxysporum f. sp. rapae]
MAFSGPSRAAAWTLSLPTSSQPVESAVLPDDGSKGSSESIIGEDLRQLVDSRDIQEGGKYRYLLVTAKDVAFIQLDRPFTGNLRLFSYLNTPETGNGTYLGVVGYPGDQTLEDEQGAQMYEEFARSDYNIGESPRHMIEYSISTFAGQSGAPVLRNSNGQLRAIRTHSYGGGGFDSNSGTTIGNALGNNYEDLISLFDKRTTFGDIGKVQVVQTQNRTTSSNEPYGLNRGYPGSTFETPRFDEESFFDTLKRVAHVGRNAFSVASPSVPSVVILSTDIVANGPAERAVLAEAALQAIFASEHDEHVTEVINKMGQFWKAGAPKVDILAPAITPILAQCSVELSDQVAPEV